MNAQAHWEDLRNEFNRLTIGPLWLAEVNATVRTVAPKYPPAAYTETGVWNQAAYDNVVQDVVVSQLLEAGQLDYIMEVASDLSAARALLAHIVRRSLARTRRRTIIDNLLDRASAIVPFPTEPAASATASAVLYATATEIAKLPRIRIINSDRAPVVLTTETLGDALELVTDRLGRPATRDELSRILQLALTDYVPSGLVLTEGGIDEPDRAFNPEEEVVMQDALNDLTSLPAETLRILAIKLAGHSDTTVAEHLGVSRPTAVNRFRVASDTVSSVVAGLESRVQNEILTRFADALLARYLPNLDLTGGQP